MTETERNAMTKRGIEVFSFNINSLSIPEEQKKITEWEEIAMTTNPATAAEPDTRSPITLRGRQAPGPLWNNRRKRYGRNAGIQMPMLRWRHPV